MRIFILLSLVFVGKTLALSTYKRQARSISFSDDASVSAGLGGIGGKLKKSIGVTVPHDFLRIFGLSNESDSKEIGLNIEGGIGFKPKLSLGEDNGGFGISLGGSGGLGIGMTSNNKRPSEKGHPNKHDKSKKHQESSEESKISGIGKSITHSLDGNVKSGHADGKTSLDADKISTDDLGGGISIGVTGKKYNRKHNEYESHKQHYTKHDGSKGHQSSTNTNWVANKHPGDNKNSYWNEGDIIVIPFSDEEKSDEDVDRKSRSDNSKTYSTKRNKTSTNNLKDDLNTNGVIVISFEDSEEFDEMSSSGIKYNGGIKDHNNHGEKKRGKDNKHITGKESIIISHGKGGQSNNKRHHEIGNDNSQVKKLSKENKIENSGEKRVNGSMERGENIAISHGKDGQYSGDKGYKNGNGNSNSHVNKESIVISSGDHNQTKEQTASKQTKTENRDKNESNYDKGGQPQPVDHTESRNNDVKKENTNHSNGKHVTINGSHGDENQKKNSTGHDGVVVIKESDTKKNNGHLCNYGEILSAGKCGSNMKSTLQLVQTFIRNCDSIIHFLLELNESDLHKVLCQVSPHNSKLSCQLGCDVLHIRPVLKYF